MFKDADKVFGCHKVSFARYVGSVAQKKAPFISLNFFLFLKEKVKKACKINNLYGSFPH